MHELSLLVALRELVEAQVRRHGGGHVRTITLRIGVLAGVEPDALRFAHGVVMEGSVAEGSRLEIEDVPLEWHCGPCGRPFRRGEPTCPRCGALSSVLLRGRELELAAIELEETGNQHQHQRKSQPRPQSQPKPN
ncbi:MAG: hydrogenase maturation nickel metallochaperone HypA [Synechococcus sp.]|nr:hydrogenase maturation nickel metallochaperone HypA [Synechococcus sp.]